MDVKVDRPRLGPSGQCNEFSSTQWARPFQDDVEVFAKIGPESMSAQVWYSQGGLLNFIFRGKQKRKAVYKKGHQ
eukprot:589233-Pyramimonas_sp.AAC.1